MVDDEKTDPKPLWQSYWNKGRMGDRDELIVHYLYLVKFVVGRMGTKLPSHVKLDDLYSSGITGLIRAVEKFDPNKNAKFESYAILLTKGAIIDEMRSLDWVPRSIHQKSNQIAKVQAELQKKLGREPDDQEMAENLGITEGEFLDWLDKVRPAIFIPLNASAFPDEEEDVTLSEKIPDHSIKTSSEIADRNEFKKLLTKFISKLPEQEKKVLILYYYEEMMLKEIGKVLGVSESRVSQIHTKAILKLRGQIQSYT